MHKSLTILLPVYNAQATLQQQVSELLEFLPEITSEFEVVIIDDASTDQTEDVGLDLARRYPQVRVLRQSKQVGHAAAVEAGLARTTGEFVFVNDPGTPLTEHDVQRLWKMRSDSTLVMARAHVYPRNIEHSLLKRLMAWGEAVKKQHSTEKTGSVQMIRRSAIESLTQVNQPEQAITVDRDELTDAVRIIKATPAGQVPPPASAVFSTQQTSEQLSYF